MSSTSEACCSGFAGFAPRPQHREACEIAHFASNHAAFRVQPERFAESWNAFFAF